MQKIESDIREKLIDYVYESSLAFEGNREDIPLDTSLIEVGILDSYGIMELVAFIEHSWDIEITAQDFTVERMGSINKMARLIAAKITK